MQFPTTYNFTYNAAGRLSGVTYEGTTRAAYLYNGRDQLVSRTLTNMGSGVDGTIHSIHDIFGNIIAETDGAGGMVRDYIWIPGAGHAGVSLPIAVVENDLGRQNIRYVHTDHVSRPIMMTSIGKVVVWQAEWDPFGASHSITGSLGTDQRFPGHNCLPTHGKPVLGNSSLMFEIVAHALCAT